MVRDECTEPVVRENLELQERLVAHEQTKADLEDRLTATRSEVGFLSFFLFMFMFLFLFILLSIPVLPLVFKLALVHGLGCQASLLRGLANSSSNVTISR